ncbi:MAG: Sec-independent protein translocase protein TatB [Pseudomonadota bacterium]
MIDLGLTKIALIGVVALVVIGPEKLPKVARMVGSLYGRAQRYIRDVKDEVSREIELDELRNLQKDVQSAAQDIEHGIGKNLAETHSELNGMWDDENHASSTHGANCLLDPHTPDQLAVKVKEFRRKKLARTSAIPTWYKQQHGTRMRIISGAARVAKYRPSSKTPHTFY